MATALDREIRGLLDKAVRKARIVAEDGARKALTELGVEDGKRPDRLPPAQAELRNRLRAHARSLGDVMQSDDSIKANRLVREIEYEHWHRALFARFLAENNLLIDPAHKVAVSLPDLEEIAKEEGRDFVELAADWAEPMLPQIFRKDDPVLALALPPETKAGITEIVKGLPRAVFAADDSLGWGYQFWQADSKERIDNSEVKIGADELPAVTQLFTEDYMVLFLLENTLGAWWAGKVLAVDTTLAADAKSEEELRIKTSPPGYRWTYLRFVRQPREGETPEAATGPWVPSASAFKGWPNAAKDITVLDPCMGSGHFLVFALPILVAFRRAEEGLDEQAAVKSVLAENLHGLEVDPRCAQIAAFALALASWKRLGGPQPLPPLNLACSGLAIGLGKTEFLKLAERIADTEGWVGTNDLLGTDRPLGTTAATTHRGELATLYDLFEQAPYLGSLVDPRRTLERTYGSLYATGIDQLGRLLERLIQVGEGTAETREVAVTAQGLAKAAELLSRQYHLVATNVPFVGKSKQSRSIQKYSAETYKSAASNLFATMSARILDLLQDDGVSAIVTPIAWWLQTSYAPFREHVLSQGGIRLGVDLGRAAFSEMNWWALVHVLTIIEKKRGGVAYLIDASEGKWPPFKARSVLGSEISVVRNEDFSKNPDCRIAKPTANRTLLSNFASGLQGISPADGPHFSRFFWERISIGGEWLFWQGTVVGTKHFGGRELILWNGNDLVQMVEEGKAYVRGDAAWGRKGIVVSQMGHLPVTLYLGEHFDTNCAAIVPQDPDDCGPIWAFCADPKFHDEVRHIDKKTNVTNSTLVKVPFDFAYWRKVYIEEYPTGLPRPYSNDLTQWLFDGHPRGSADPNVTADSSTNLRLVTPHGVRAGKAEHPLQVAVARLLGYRWPRQTGSSFMDCPAAIEPDEVDRSGLINAAGIAPLPALAGEADAATRLRDMIRALWGVDYGEGTIRELLVAEEAKATDLGTWLADEFFDRHCRLLYQTPFIWHVWDGVRGGFSALVNYHRLCEGNGAGRRLLEKLRDSYLGEWIAAQRRALAASEAGAEERLIAAEHLRGELTKIIEGDPPYDIFVRWRPLHHQSIGWEPDIDDGVRLNIRPFLTAKPKDCGRRDACILRVTPRVKNHAGADRGAEPHREKEEFPWFWAEDSDVEKEDFAGGPAFKGRRYNDFHYTRAFKQRARDAKATAARGVA